ncbi:hypothetical protein B7G54_12035 [Burkholderia puraquae]|nr:hypothetical protein B7G54_12035 [Burkholderia puraquae]
MASASNSLHKCRVIITQRVAMEQGACCSRLIPFSAVVFDPPRCGIVVHGYDAIVAMPASESALPAASGMIDARHIVDAMTFASSPVQSVRDGRIVHFPERHGHDRAMTMRIGGAPELSAARSGA